MDEDILWDPTNWIISDIPQNALGWENLISSIDNKLGRNGGGEKNGTAFLDPISKPNKFPLNIKEMYLVLEWDQA